MLHLFAGLAMHEQLLDEYGRNRDNVLAVRQADSRRIWEHIKELATEMAAKWSKSTKLGAGARYIIKHYDKLTAYLDDPRRSQCERLVNQMTRHGCRRARGWGLGSAQLQAHLIAMRCNLQLLARVLAKRDQAEREAA